MNRPLLPEFAAVLAGLDWDVALLQEAPPRWQRPLAERAGAASAIALTDRNFLPSLRRALADWNPDLIASNEGGSNQLLVRPPLTIAEVRRLRVSDKGRECRRMLWARVQVPGPGRLCVATLHTTAGDPPVAAAELEQAAERAADWAAGEPLVLGGDFNLQPRQEPGTYQRLHERFGLAGPTAHKALDHILARGLEVLEPPRLLPPEAREVPGPDGLRIRLSDHAQVTATFGVK